MPEDHAAPEAYDTDHHWDKERRPPEELHSALGPNLEPAPKQRKVEALDDTVNPEDHDWHTAWKDVDVHKLRAAWEALREEKPELDVGKREDFQLHDFQQLFVTLVLRHAEEVVAAWKAHTVPKPLRLLLLGTAGTGKTLALQTALQALADRGLLRDFVRVAAPTGTAAFNVGFNATTIHRLIH